MSNSNSQNPGNGAEFQEKVYKYFCDEYQNHKFEKEKAIEIGKPPRKHRYDIASEDNKIVIECKCYTWTESGNSPSAKLRTLNEAILYFTFLNNCKKYLVMSRSTHPKQKESLAEYYYRRYKHLLTPHNVILAEYDKENKIFQIISDKS